MGLHGKLIASVEFKAGGDVFHDLIANKPHDVSQGTPDKVQGCDLLKGEYGKPGSIICWRYTREGEERMDTQIIQAIDEEKQRVELKMIDGPFMKIYKDLVISTSVEKKVVDIDLVTWTMEYETLSDEEAEHPISMLAYLLDITNDLEAHHLNKP